MKFTMFSVDRLAVLALIITRFSAISLATPILEKPALEKRVLPVVMGLAKSFGALAASTLTNTGATAITGTGGVGNAGVYPGTAITGFPPGTVSGVLAPGTVLAKNGQAACLLAYNNSESISPTIPLSSSNLGGLTLGPGAYTIPTLAGTLTGNLTLDAGGNSKKQFIFKFNTTFTAAAGSQILLINSAQACNVYFVTGTSITIGAGAKLVGNFLAKVAITVASGASIQGTLCALGAAITLILDAIVVQAGTCPT